MIEAESPAPLAGGEPGARQNGSTAPSIADSQEGPDSRLPPGTNRCRCAGCGRYFGGVNGFERHRVSFNCIDPASVGLVLNSRGYWVRPAPRLAAIHGGKRLEADFFTLPATVVQDDLP